MVDDTSRLLGLDGLAVVGVDDAPGGPVDSNAPAMVTGMPWTEPVTTTLPGHQVEMLRAILAEGQARSMSAWIAEAVAKRLADPENAAARRRPR
jgi:hypothetical protein